MISQLAEPQLWDAPLTTGAIFLTLTGAITYLYRARDRDRESEIARLIAQIERLNAQIERLQEKDSNHEP